MESSVGSSVRHEKVGGWAALYLALAYVAAMPYFLLVLRVPTAGSSTQKVSLLVDHHGSLQAVYLLTYVIFGVALAMLSLSLYRGSKGEAPVLAQAAAVVGIIWAFVLVAGGMTFIAGVTAVVDAHATDPAQATSMWRAIEPVAEGLGGSGGELLGGLWVLLVSAAALRGRKSPRSLAWLGVVVGTAGVVSVIPVLRDLAYVFGILQIVWFAWLGAVLLRPLPRVTRSIKFPAPGGQAASAVE